ncbi:hypothetical protein NliqN6_0671 [Naganishia liquefaciens]|uniref:GP-PDE domain-containing protein n=1 Tax=Naganishia liquefaciens TaxID=104408 RepID=A0A8H3TNU1_9TREE|nr:hypothetical protein NliqN6_0671 [Naganishia liquefaciens]
MSGLALSVEDANGKTTLDSGKASSLDVALRCRMDDSAFASTQANSGANANSDVTNVSGGTSESLSNDIWRWKRHKGIVYANSHNDEMQGDRAFTHALSLGLASMEADVWLATADVESNDPVLLVGHEDRDLKDRRTLKQIYLDPIWEILERVNEGNDGSRGWKGVFTDRGVPDQTLILQIDTKNEVDGIYAELRKLIHPFVEKGYLSRFERSSPNSSIIDGKLTLGPLTIVGTGDTPIHSILSDNPRYIFKDGPLTKLDEPIRYSDPESGDLISVDWHPSFAPMASAKFSVASHASYLTSSVIFMPIRQAFRLAFSTPAFLSHADSSKFVQVYRPTLAVHHNDESPNETYLSLDIGLSELERVLIGSSIETTNSQSSIMTSLNPTHFPASSDNNRRGQAIYKRNAGEDFSEEYDEAGYPKSVKKLDRDARREARQRIKRVQPPIPDLRFEQSYLLSIRPFLHPRVNNRKAAAVMESSTAGGPESHTLTTSSKQDEVFSWGRDVDVDYKDVLWVTFRDQLVSPLIQGFFWGVLTVSISAFSQAGRTALYPASHKSKGRITGGEGSGLSQAGAGEAVGETQEEGWWRKWVKSWSGGLESLVALK